MVHENRKLQIEILYSQGTRFAFFMLKGSGASFGHDEFFSDFGAYQLTHALYLLLRVGNVAIWFNVSYIVFILNW